MRLLQKHLTVFFLAFFILFSLVITPQSLAATSIFTGLPPELQPKSTDELLNEFCNKRSGDLMNLETWYSGKCGVGVDTLSGDGVGFSDIVLLQGMEYINGPQTYDFITTIIMRLNVIREIKENIASGQISPSETNLAGLNNGGLVASLGSFTSKLVTYRPASSLDYLAYVSTNLKNHHVIDQAYAAGPGYGFTALSPILPLWRAFRNIAYLLFALGFVMYGVMIMFRIKIDAKTAASIQLAIPKLIVTLLVITFSYAIVGFLIDISTVVSAMVINILKAGQILDSSSLSIGSTTLTNPIASVAAGQSKLGAIGSIIINGFTASIVAPFIFFNLIIGGIVGVAASFAAIIAGTISGIGVVLTIIVMIAVGISYVKLIGKLFMAFFSIIINLIFSPIILLGNLMPGSNAISSWLMSIIGNLAVFPVAAFFLVLSYALMVQPVLTFVPELVKSWSPTATMIANAAAGALGFETNWMQTGLEAVLGVKSLASLGNIWTPPMTVPFGSSDGSLMLATIGFGLLMMASKYCEMVEKALKTPPFPYGAAIGEALKYGVGKNEAWAGKGYAGLPSGGVFDRARGTYKRGVDASGALKEKPSLFVGGTDTGFTAPK